MENINYRQLDVWAIYRDPEHVFDALKIILDSKDKIKKPLTLFTNCVSNFTIDGKKIERNMDTLICSPEADIALILSAARYYDEDLGLISATPEIIARFLDKHEIPYEIVVGEPKKENLDDKDIPEIWMVRERFVLEDSLEESKQKGCTTCNLYSDTSANLSMGYYLSDGSYNEIWGLNYNCLVETDNSWTFMIDENDERNLSNEEVKQIIEEKGFEYIEKGNVKLKK